MATGDDNNDGNRVTTMITTMKTTAQRATKLTMMVMTTPMALGNNDNDGDGATGNCKTGYNDDNNGEG